MNRSLLLTAAFSYALPDAVAQNTGGVFGPVVVPGHTSAQYRIGFDPDNEDLAQRFHIQSAFNSDAMARIIVQVRQPGGGDTDIDFTGAELFWQITPDGQPFQSGLRFDGRIRSEGRPGVLGVNWSNQYSVSPKLHLRGILLTSVDVGDDARDGVFLQTRGRISYRLASGSQLGLDLFSNYGSTDDIRDFDEQSHQVGPFAQIGLGEGWSLFGSILFGVTDGADDANLKFWVIKGF